MRLIDADPLFERTVELEAVALKQVGKYEPSENPIEWNRWSGILLERTAFKYDLMDAPTIEAEPIRHGKWKKSGYWGRVYKCDQCGHYLDFDGVNAGRGDANFCPNCGAKMDEVEDND